MGDVVVVDVVSVVGAVVVEIAVDELVDVGNVDFDCD